MMPLKLPDKPTIGECYGPAMEITDPAEAAAYFELLVSRHLLIAKGRSRAEAESIERQNLGYYAGYYDTETRARVERLFSCAHPIFGSIAENGVPSPEKAFELGKELARRSTHAANDDSRGNRRE